MVRVWASVFVLLTLATAGCEGGADASSYKQAVLQHRMQRDMDLRERGSVLPSAVRERFVGLHYFPVDSTYRYEVPFERQTPPDTVWMAESTGGLAPQLRVGYVTVPLPEGAARLAVFYTGSAQTEAHWVPFADQTNGAETYEAGRYVDVELAAGADTAVVDFNRAYNPTCAYNPDYACPLPPSENRLAQAVPAGEKKPQLY